MDYHVLTFSVHLIDTWGFFQNHVFPPQPSKSYLVVSWWVAQDILTTQSLRNLGLGLYGGL